MLWESRNRARIPAEFELLARRDRCVPLKVPHTCTRSATHWVLAFRADESKTCTSAGCVVVITQIGKHATADTAGHAAVPAFKETARDFKSFERRTGALPEQQVNGGYLSGVLSTVEL